MEVIYEWSLRLLLLLLYLEGLEIPGQILLLLLRSVVHVGHQLGTLHWIQYIEFAMSIGFFLHPTFIVQKYATQAQISPNISQRQTA